MPEYFAEPDPTTQEMTAAHARSYALSAPHPQGAAAAERPPQIPLAPVKRVQAQFNPLADGMIYLVVFLGGVVGTAMRYALSLAMPAPLAQSGFFSAFHTATFVANMTACFIFAGLTSYMAQASWIRKRVRQLTSRGVGMGMCGGFSTLSAMVIEELTSIHGDQIGGFLFYMFASFAVGMLVAALGSWLATVLASRKAARIASDAIDDRTRASRRETSGAAGASGESIGHKAPKDRSRSRLFRHIKDDPVVHIVDDSSSVFVDVTSSTPPSGDYGQPVRSDASASSASASAAGTAGAGVGPMTGVPSGADDATTGAAGVTGVTNDMNVAGDANGTSAAWDATATVAPSFEPAPITDEIPMVGDPSTGDARESDASGRDGDASSSRTRGAHAGGAESVRYFRGAHADQGRWRR